jgi:hypothetical protein
MGDYAKALEYHENAVKIQKIALPENHPSLAISTFCREFNEKSLDEKKNFLC